MTTDTKHPLTLALESAGVALRVITRPTQATAEKQSDGKAWKHFAWTVALCGIEGKPRPESEPIPYKMGVAHVVQPTPEQDRYFKARGHYGFHGTKVGTPVAPTIETVVHSLIMDSSACNESFDDWCDGLGYDTDSKKATEIYMACQRNGSLIRKFLGKDYAAIAEAAQDY